ncbi:MAG: FkbM family methyltransferase [Cyanobacteriota bacterium]|nr:FkbM family methyltransferase [Cyanobacteriota bacterium]
MNCFSDRIESINFVDLGCSGYLDTKWSNLLPLLAYTGFDPNQEECGRLNAQPHPYQSACYLAYAIAGETGMQTMYLTESIYCYSLLSPNSSWLKRFSFANLFTVKGTQPVTCNTLDALVETNDLKADIIKLDTQGLELPILKAGEKLLKKAFCVETETGFVENYIGETTYAQIDEFMRSRGFLLFDFQYHRASRKNPLADSGKHQPLWCEAVWLFDFIGQNTVPNREQAFKSLAICQALRYYDYGFELASYFKSLDLIDTEMLNFLENPENWESARKPPSSKLAKILKLLPQSLNRRLLFALEQLLQSSV